MQTKPLLWPRLILLLAAGVAVAGWLRGADPRPSDPRVTALIEKLGSDDFGERQAATHDLGEIGEPALIPLQSAAKQSTDPEVRRRAEELVQRLLFVSRTTGLELVPIKAGEFEMGSPGGEKGRSGDEKLHRVQISDFRLGKFEVTQQQFVAVMKRNPSAFNPAGEFKARVADQKTEDFPVEGPTWFDALEFCNKLSELDRCDPYYTLANVKREKEKIIAADVTVRGGTGYRLPTEAEWEYACRARTDTPFHFGMENTGREANVVPVMVGGGYGGAVPKFPHLQRTVKVGSYEPNAWGLREMHGNVAEWCWDSYAKDYYDRSPAADPQGAELGPHRVVRGGSWMVPEESCRSACRFFQTPNESKPFLGFRVARSN